jgi:hypothetical protein
MEAVPEQQLGDLVAELEALKEAVRRLEIATEANSRKLDALMLAIDKLPGNQLDKEFYTVDEFAARFKRSPYTCREYCRHGRLRATKQRSGRGKYCAWVISRAEVLRFEEEGMLPPAHRNGKPEKKGRTDP